MVRVDKSKCIGCGLCVSICGEVFELKGDKATIKAQKDVPCVKEAIESCPVNAITE
jgi:ferredoxin